MGLSQQEYWSGLQFPTPGDLPTQGSNSRLLHLLDCQAKYYLKQTWVRLEVQFLWRQNVPPAVNQISCVLPKYSGGTSIG